MRCKGLYIIIPVLLVAFIAQGCGSSKTAQRGDVQADPARQAIIAEHNILAETKRQELAKKQQEEIENALSVINNEQEDAVRQVKDQLTADLETAKEDARANLAEEEVDAKIQELEAKYQTDLDEQTAQITAQYEEKRTARQAEYTKLHEQEMQELETTMQSELQEKLAQYDLEKTTSMVEPAAAAQPEAAPVQPVAPVVQPEAMTAVVTPAPGTKAPVEPVTAMAEPRLTEKGLRLESDAPLGQRKHYVNEYFRSGEMLQEIAPADELRKRERHEAIVTFWMEGTARSASPRFMINGVPVATWQELESRLAEFRLALINEKYLLYAKVILDQKKDVPRSVVDDILSVCFKAGIRDISMGSKEPRIED